MTLNIKPNASPGPRDVFADGAGDMTDLTGAGARPLSTGPCPRRVLWHISW